MGPLAGRTGAHEAIGQDLDRNIALQASVAGAVDDTHAAAAQLFEHFVRPDYLLHAINSVPFRSHLRRNQGFIQIITLSSGQSPGSSARNDGIGRSGTRASKESIMVVVPSGTCEKILLGCEAGSRIETGCALVRCKLNVREVESTASSRGNSQHILAHRSMRESTRL
jgi:hypothetical protein